LTDHLSARDHEGFAAFFAEVLRLACSRLAPDAGSAFRQGHRSLRSRTWIPRESCRRCWANDSRSCWSHFAILLV